MLTAIGLLALIFGLVCYNAPAQKITYNYGPVETTKLVETIEIEDVIEETIITENYIP